MAEQNNNTVKETSFFMKNHAFYEDVPRPGKGVRSGKPYRLNGVAYGNYQNADHNKQAQPGVWRSSFIPTFGVNLDTSDPITQGSIRPFKLIQDALKQRNLPYQRVDVMVHLMAYGSMIMGWEFLTRGVHCLNNSSKYTTWFPRAFASGCGIDYDDWIDNLPNIKRQVKKWKTALGNYAVPLSFAFINDHRDMMKYAFADSVSVKSQKYTFVPAILWSYAGVDTVEGLTPVTFIDDKPGAPAADLKWEEFAAKFEQMIEAITDSTDFDVINGAINSSFPESEFYTFEIPNYDSEVEIWHDAGFLTAILNARAFEVEDYTEWQPVDAGNNVLTTKGKVKPFRVVLRDVFNCITDNPTSPEMVNYLRWHPTFEQSDDADAGSYVRSMGTEFLTCFTIITDPKIKMLELGEGPAESDQYEVISNRVSFCSDTFCGLLISDGSPYGLSGRGGSIEVMVLALLSLISAFRWHPIFYYASSVNYGADENGDSPTFVGFLPLAFTEWNFFIVLGADDIVATHEMYLWSAIDTPTGRTTGTADQTDQGKTGK